MTESRARGNTGSSLLREIYILLYGEKARPTRREVKRQLGDLPILSLFFCLREIYKLLYEKEDLQNEV